MLIGRNHAAVCILFPGVASITRPPPTPRSYVTARYNFSLSCRLINCEAHSFLANRFTPLLLSDVPRKVRLLPVLTGCDVECVGTSPPMSAPNFRSSP